MPKKHKRDPRHMRREFLTGVVFVLVGLGVTLLLERAHLLAWPQRALLDAMPDTLTSTAARDVVIVTINDADYADLFHRQSPLDPKQVAAILGDIQFFSPRVIGIDLDTEDWKPADSERVPKAPGRLVWARLFTADPSAPLRIAELGKVQGSDGAGFCSGLTAMQADSDLRIRQYPAEYQQIRGGQTVVYPSFPLVVLRMDTEGSCPAGVEGSAEARTEGNWDENRLLIRYRGSGHDIRKIPAGAVIDTRELARQAPDNPAVQQMKTLLGGRMVLLGGTYRAGRDSYPTPVGMVSGVEILGQAILTASEGPIKEPGSGLVWFDLLLGLALVVLGLWYPRTAMALNIAFLLLLLPISGWLFRSFAFFLDAIPVQIGVLLHSTLHPVLEKHVERL
jgi:hypothetical protein